MNPSTHFSSAYQNSGNKNLTDKELYELCKTYGEKALHWRRKFTGLLPEVNRRRLYEKKGFVSIFEFAKKLCGLSEEQVRLTLNLDRRFEDKPALKVLLVNGEVSINKLTRLSSVATSENESFWAEKVQQLSQSAIETLVRDEKQNGLFEPQNEAKSLRAQKLAVGSDELNLAPDVMAELLKLQAKGIDVSEVLREMLEERKLKIALEKERLSAEAEALAVRQGAGLAGQAAGLARAPFRHIPAKIKRHLEKEYGTKCSIEGCGRGAQVIHHTQRFALAGTHNPKYLAPLCKQHHAIAHTIDARVQANKGFC